MSDIDWNRLVVATATHGEKYLGYVPTEAQDPSAYMEEHGCAGLPVRLIQARNLVSQVQPNIGSDGRLVGMGRLLLLMPIDMLTTPMAAQWLVPSSWYFPGQCGDACKKKVTELIRHSEENEMRMSAEDAGISLAMPRRPQ